MSDLVGNHIVGFSTRMKRSGVETPPELNCVLEQDPLTPLSTIGGLIPSMTEKLLTGT